MDAELGFRLVFGLILGLTILMSGYHRKKARASGETIARRAEGTRTLLLRIVLAAPLFGSFLLYVFVPGAMRWSAFDLPLWVRFTGAGLAALCLPLLWWVFVSIGKNISETVLTKQNHQLVTKGPYRWVRHPLYALALLQFFGLGLLASNGFMLLLCVLGVLVFRSVVIPREEENLIGAFGDEYRAYQTHAGALLPRFRSSMNT